MWPCAPSLQLSPKVGWGLPREAPGRGLSPAFPSAELPRSPASAAGPAPGCRVTGTSPPPGLHAPNCEMVVIPSPPPFPCPSHHEA